MSYELDDVGLTHYDELFVNQSGYWNSKLGDTRSDKSNGREASRGRDGWPSLRRRRRRQSGSNLSVFRRRVTTRRHAARALQGKGKAGRAGWPKPAQLSAISLPPKRPDMALNFG